jgi:LysM repeat protein
MRFPSVAQFITILTLFMVLLLIPFKVQAVDIYLLHTNNTNGALENCLCPGKSYGSLEKRIHYVRDWLKDYPNTIIVDAGDFLSSTRKTLKDSIAFRGYELIPYDAVALGDQEFFRGIPFLSGLMEDSDLPFLASNLKEPQLPNLQSEILVERNGITFGFFSVLDPSIFRFYPKSVSEAVDFLSYEDVATRHTLALKEKADVVVMLSHFGIEKDRELAGSVEGIDIIVGSHSQSILKEPEKIGNTLIVQAGKDGYYVGELKLTFDEEKELQSYNGKLIPMDISLPNDAIMVDMIIEYNRLKRQSLTRRVERISPIPEEYIVTPAAKCGNCHPENLEHWLTTPHSSSFATLEHEHKHKSPDCLSCHTSGFGRDDGYLNYNITAGLKTVNCTECHYVPESHLEESGLHELEPVIEEACLRCHDQKNSPSFEFASFTERIRHPVIEEVVEIEPIEEEVALREAPPPEPEISDEPVVEEEDILSEAPTAAEELQEDTVIAEISLTLEPELSEALETVAVTEEVAVEEEVKEEKPTLHLTHEVAAGENLWKLAVQYLSAGKRWQEIYELNRENISNPELILVGQELQIPSSKEKE